jgi:hypothetical protein
LQALRKVRVVLIKIDSGLLQQIDQFVTAPTTKALELSVLHKGRRARDQDCLGQKLQR